MESLALSLLCQEVRNFYRPACPHRLSWMMKLDFLYHFYFVCYFYNQYKSMKYINTIFEWSLNEGATRYRLKL